MVEHTADISIRAFGNTKEDLFSHAALGMMEFQFGHQVLSCEPDQSEQLVVESADQESLLVDWLSELLYLMSTKYRAYTRFEFTKLTETSLEAKVWSCSAEALQYIKAATYHNLAIKKTKTGWSATVVFDV